MAVEGNGLLSFLIKTTKNGDLNNCVKTFINNVIMWRHGLTLVSNHSFDDLLSGGRGLQLDPQPPANRPPCPYAGGVCLFFPQNGVLNSSKKQALFHHHLWVPGRVPGFVFLLFWHSVPSSFLVPGRVPGFVSLLFWHSVPASFLVPGRVASRTNVEPAITYVEPTRERVEPTNEMNNARLN